MTKAERYREVERVSAKRLKGAPKRKRRAVIVRIVFVVGVAAAVCLAVIGTQPKNAARFKRWVSSVTAQVRGVSTIDMTGNSDSGEGNV